MRTSICWSHSSLVETLSKARKHAIVIKSGALLFFAFDKICFDICLLDLDIFMIDFRRRVLSRINHDSSVKEVWW